MASPTYPTVTNFSGLAAFNKTVILAPGTYEVSIFAVDVTTGETWVAIKDYIMRQINGVKVQEGYVYWTSGANFSRAKLYSNVTASAGELIAKGTSFDDFAIAPDRQNKHHPRTIQDVRVFCYSG